MDLIPNLNLMKPDSHSVINKHVKNNLFLSPFGKHLGNIWASEALGTSEALVQCSTRDQVGEQASLTSRILQEFAGIFGLLSALTLHCAMYCNLASIFVVKFKVYNKMGHVLAQYFDKCSVV